MAYIQPIIWFLTYNQFDLWPGVQEVCCSKVREWLSYEKQRPYNWLMGTPIVPLFEKKLHDFVTFSFLSVIKDINRHRPAYCASTQPVNTHTKTRVHTDTHPCFHIIILSLHTHTHTHTHLYQTTRINAPNTEHAKQGWAKQTIYTTRSLNKRCFW